MSTRLTAEQVREVIERYSTELLGGGRLFIERDIQTIADELNAALDCGECEDASTRFNAWVCSECKATLLLMFDDFDEPTYSVDGVADVPRHCPNCGKAVKR